MCKVFIAINLKRDFDGEIKKTASWFYYCIELLNDKQILIYGSEKINQSFFIKSLDKNYFNTKKKSVVLFGRKALSCIDYCP